MKISVVIPSFNQGRFLSGLLAFLKRKRHHFHDLLILDGGSSDCTLEVINRNLDVISFWRSHADEGQAAAVNEGIERATGDIIVWVNSDDMLCEDAFVLISEHFGHSGSHPVLAGSSLCVNQDASIVRIYPNVKDCRSEWWMYGVSLFSQPAVVFKKSVWEDVGGLNADLHYSLDYDFFIRIINKGIKVKLLGKPIGVMRFYEGIKSFSTKVVPEMEETTRRNFGQILASNKKTHFQRFGLKVFRVFGFFPVIGYIVKRFEFSNLRNFPGIYARSSDKAQCPIEATQVLDAN